MGVCIVCSNAASFGMNIFKYCMNLLRTRVIQEWQDLIVTYPSWLMRILEDNMYYTASVIVVCVNAFAVGLAIGFIMSL
jgi:hypothetical protein